MPDEDSVTHWIDRIKEGDSVAAQRLWERYFEKLVRFARHRLEGFPRRVADEEDVAISAFKSFCRAAERGRFPDLADRDGLWHLLLRITGRKTVDLIRYNHRQKRKVQGESVLGAGNSQSAPGIAQVIGNSPTPEFAAMVTDEYRRLLDRLGESELQTVAVAKMDGFSNKEIAGQVDCSVRTVERQLQLIRKKWELELGK